MIALVAGCATAPHKSPDAAFQRLSSQYQELKFGANPLEAVALGLHRYDGKFGDYSASALQNQTARLMEMHEHLKHFPESKLSAPWRHDIQLLRHDAAKSLWYLNQIRAPYVNPMTYAGALDVSIYIKRDFAPLKDRTRFMTRILERTPELFAAARANLESQLPRPFVETAISIADGTADFLEKDIMRDVSAVAEPKILEAFRHANTRAVTELRQYASWLNSTLL